METEYSWISRQVSRFGAVQNLMHCVNKATLEAAHKRQSVKKAAGIDKVTKDQYGENLEQSLESLLKRMKKFSYRPQPVRRTYIEKPGSNKMRPLGIPAYEDKLVQGVMANILTVIYEPKFKEFSYGFRPHKSCHMAIKALEEVIITKKTNFIVDADIKGFFDNVNHEWLIKFLEHDI
jgi:retron-type reverse transcriptase